jgi:hypothetical protein
MRLSAFIASLTLLLTAGRFAVAGQALSLAQASQYLVLPSTIAQVTDGNWTPGRTLPEFILVQDVHKHPEVQSRIAAVVMEGYQKWGVRKVFLEGAFSTVDMSMFQNVPEEARELVLNQLTQRGDLSGPELAAVMLMKQELESPETYSSPFQLIGMEDPRVYRQNLAAYQEVQASKTVAMQALQNVRIMHRELGLRADHPLVLQLSRTESLLQLRLTPSDYSDYLVNQNQKPSSPALNPAIEAAERFYQLVDERSRVFLRLANSKVPASPGPRILVVGGFHTPAMAEELRKQQRSFVVLTPQITRSGLAGVYQKRLMESVSALRVGTPLRTQMQGMQKAGNRALIGSESIARP